MWIVASPKSYLTTFVAGLISGFFLGAHARAADMSFDNGTVTLSGRIEVEDPYMLDYRIAANKWKVTGLRLNSGGGSTEAGYQIAHMVSTRHWATLADGCESACVVVWAAGRPRSLTLTGNLSVHQPSFTLGWGGAHREASYEATAIMGRYLAGQGAPGNVVYRMMSTPPDAVYWLSEADLKKWGVERQ